MRIRDHFAVSKVVSTSIMAALNSSQLTLSLIKKVMLISTNQNPQNKIDWSCFLLLKFL